MKFYVDLAESVSSSKPAGQHLTEACMILTFLHVLGTCMHKAPINGVDLRVASHAMIPRLEKHLRRAVRTLNPAECLYYNDAYLLMFYVCTVDEDDLNYDKTAPEGLTNDPRKPDSPKCLRNKYTDI
jgi:hypothetical protein